jgi:Raf kinase inhibitor-like YbhB/YbcL family protein
MKFLPGLGLIATTMLVAVGAAQQSAPAAAAAPVSPMVMMMPGFADGGTIPNRFTCVAGPAVVSPEIRWSNAPAGTQSFVLVFHDLEPHPAKGIMDNSHWVLWNIPATATGLAEGVPAGSALPDGTHQMKRTRTIPGSFFSYYGPCAPKGPNHHYVFELFALDSALNLAEDATRADILKASDGHVLGAAAWIGVFHQ